VIAAAVGMYLTVTVSLAPAARVEGTVSPISANWVEETVTLENVMLLVPEFFSVSATVLLVSSGTLPKSTDAGLKASVPDALATGEIEQTAPAAKSAPSANRRGRLTV
jgi:hypothetical protein